jgi:hypothetical protein
LVPAAAALLPDLHPADALLLAPLASDASAGVHPDEAADAIAPALAALPCAEKLAVPAPVVPAPIAKLPPARLPAEAEALCIPDAGRSAA